MHLSDYSPHQVGALRAVDEFTQKKTLQQQKTQVCSRVRIPFFFFFLPKLDTAQ